MSDSFTPTMPRQMEQLLLNEATSRCWIDIKQAANAKAESIARRHFARLVELDRKTIIDSEEKDYGRKARSYSRLYTGR